MIQNSVFDLLASFIPSRRCLKYREKGDFLIVGGLHLNIYYLNSVAKDIYLAFDGKKTIKNIRDELLIVYDVEPNNLSKDIVIVIRDFQWKGLLTLRESA